MKVIGRAEKLRRDIKYELQRSLRRGERESGIR